MEFDVFTKIADCYDVEDVLTILNIEPEKLYRTYLRQLILENIKEFDIE